MRDRAKVSATIAGTCTFIAQVSGSLPVAPNFMPAMKTTFGARGSASTAARSRRSQAIVSTPRPVERAPRRRVREARDADDAALGRGALRQPGERRSHLAGDAEDQDVARGARQIVDERRRRLGHEILERGDDLEPLGKRAHPPAARARPTGSRGAAGIGRMEAKSSAAATAKPGQSSEPIERRPSAMRSRAGPVALRVKVGVRGDEGRLLGRGRERHAVDEVVAVALDMGQPEERDEAEVLLHADARPGGEILGRHEVRAAAPASAFSFATRAALRIDL